jgi:putative oxidoreductase
MVVSRAIPEERALNPQFLDTWTPRALALLRIVTCYLFLQHATAKLFGVPHIAMFDGLQLMSLPGIAGMIEIVATPFVLLGLFTRPAAFILSGEMAVAYFIGHAPNGHVLSPLLNQGESAVLFCFIFLYLSAAGPGAWSVDGMRKAGA